MNCVYLTAVICFCFFNIQILKAERRCRGKALFRRGLRNHKKLSHNVEETEIPQRFDAREKWSNCKSLFRISDQGQCGGCWAFAATSVMSDRLCIHSEGKLQDYVSAQDLLECCKNCVNEGSEYVGGCSGGYPHAAFNFWKSNGLVTGYDQPLEGCKPINKEIVQNIPQRTCRIECTNEEYNQSYNEAKTFGLDFFLQYEPLKNDLRQIQIELMENGPIVAYLRIYDYISFVGENAVLSYDKDKVGPNEEFITHVIKLIGWDETTDGTPVWIIANSWGTDWCDSGFCRVKRGVNDLNIEGFPMMAALPRLKSAVQKRTNLTENVVSSGSSTIFLNLLFNILTVVLLSHFL